MRFEIPAHMDFSADLDGAHSIEVHDQDEDGNSGNLAVYRRFEWDEGYRSFDRYCTPEEAYTIALHTARVLDQQRRDDSDVYIIGAAIRRMIKGSK